MTEKRTSIFSYVLLTMVLTHTFTHVFQHIHLAIFPIMRTEFQLSILQLGIIAAIPSLFQALFYIPMGLFSDRFGSKKMILVSSVLATLGSLMASQTINSAMLIFAVSLVYINTTLYHPAAYSLVTRLFRHRDRPKALGIHGSGGTFGIAIGPISVSVLMGFFAFGWRQVYLFWVVPILVGIFAVLNIRSEPTKDLDEYL
jgi:MFS family permease